MVTLIMAIRGGGVIESLSTVYVQASLCTFKYFHMYMNTVSVTYCKSRYGG
jgi:hypothetical protein